MLLKQLDVGCKKEGCSNKTNCVTADPSIKQPDRTKTIAYALAQLKSKDLKLCIQ